MQDITLRELVGACRRALADSKLIAMWDKTHESVVDYRNPQTGRGCAIGVAMMPETLTRIDALQREGGTEISHYMSINSVVDNKLVKISGHPKALEVASVTQTLHDAWYDGKTFGFAFLTRDYDFLTGVFDDMSQIVTQAHFTAWLDHVEKTYLTEPA